MEENKSVGRKKASVRTGLVIALVFGMLFAYTSLPHPVLVNDDGKTWHVVWEGTPSALAAEGDPGEGVSGILEIFFVNHSATACAENTSATIEGWCDAVDLGYASADDFNVELAHSVAFDVIVRVRGNQTVCYRDTEFWDSDLKVEWTCADLSVGADTAMTGVVTANVSTYEYLYMNFYDDNSGSGYTLPKDASYDITSIKFSAYY